MLIFVVGVPIVLGLFVWTGASMFRQMGIGKGTIKPQNTGSSTVTLAEEDYAKLMQERKDMENRLRVLEEQSENGGNVDRKVQEAVAQALVGAGLVTSGDGLSLGERLAQIEAGQKNLRDSWQTRGGEPDSPAEVPQPRQGSGSPTTSFTTVKAWSDGRKAEEAEAIKTAQAVKPAFVSAKGIQPGTSLAGTLKTTLISSASMDRFVAVVDSSEPLELPGGMTLPSGVRFLGKVQADFDARRIVVNVDRMLWGDVEIPVSAIVLDQRGNAGLVSKYVDPLQQSLWASFLPNMMAAAARAAQDMTTYTNSDGEDYQQPSFSASNVALQGAAGALEEQGNIMTQINARKKPVIIVRSGIPVLVQFAERVPMDALVEAGILDSKR